MYYLIYDEKTERHHIEAARYLSASEDAVEKSDDIEVLRAIGELFYFDCVDRTVNQEDQGVRPGYLF